MNTTPQLKIPDLDKLKILTRESNEWIGRDANNIYEIDFLYGDIRILSFNEKYNNAYLQITDIHFTNKNIVTPEDTILQPDISSFIHIKNKLFRDKNGIWFLRKDTNWKKEFAFTGIDLESFQIIESIGYRDKYYLYYEDFFKDIKLVDFVDLNTLELINKEFAKDKNYVYDLQWFTKVEKVDISSFIVIDEHYAKDKNYVYYRWNWTKVIEGADPKSFEVIYWWIYARDKLWVYREGCKINGVSPDGFEYIEYGVFRNSEYIYYACSNYLHKVDVIDDINTFNVTSAYWWAYWTIKAEDKNYLYTLYEDSDFDYRDKLIHTFHIEKIIK
jgi:hypothetical protein